MSKVTLGPQTLVYPKPAFLVGADVDNKPNFLAVAWGGVACGTPPMISVAIRYSRFTLKGIRQTGSFSVNITSKGLALETDYCGVVSGSKTNKVIDCDFKIFYGNLTHAPMIEQYPINLECNVVHLLQLGSHYLAIGEVLETYISEDCLTNGEPDVMKVNPISYIEGQPGDYYCLGEKVSKAFQHAKKFKKK